MVGDQVHVGAQTGERLVFHRVVAHHEHVRARHPACREVFGAVGRLGFHRGGVLVGGEPREQARVHARPRQPPLHRAAREHGHGGQHQRVALLRKRVHGARRGRVRAGALADLPEIHLVELAEQRLPVGFGGIGPLEERPPERLGVRPPVLMGRHGADASLEPCGERLCVQPVRPHERGDGLEVRRQELLQFHGKKRAVQVEEDRAVGARGGGRAVRFGHCGILRLRAGRFVSAWQYKPPAGRRRKTDEIAMNALSRP